MSDYTPQEMRETADEMGGIDPLPAGDGELLDCASDMLRAGADDIEALAEVTAYLTHLLAIVAPQCEPLPSAAGIATQIDNYIAGRHEALAAKEQEIARLRDGWRVAWADLQATLPRAEAAEAALTAERQKVRELESAAANLAKEVNGCLGLEEEAIRQAIGHTNYRCLRDKAQTVLGLNRIGAAMTTPPACDMTLRDYFAIHGDQPGQLEMAAEAGVPLREHSGLEWNTVEAQKLPTFAEWFHKLPQTERYRLYAACRYRIADAMLAEREIEAQP